ncbi:MAG: RNA polymerase sigma-70 factor [Gemmatimonadales bacterium]
MTSPRPRNEPDDRERIEREWLDRIRAGDEGAFEAMYRAHVTALCAFADSYVNSRDDAEEIVQDLFSRLWEQRLTIEMERGMRPYLYSAVRNRALNALRNRRIERSVHERLLQEDAVRASVDAPSPAEGLLAARDFAEALDRAVAEMPSRCREVFALLRYRHLTYAETAVVLAISPKTVEIHMSRALALLRERLAPWIRA